MQSVIKTIGKRHILCLCLALFSVSCTVTLPPENKTFKSTFFSEQFQPYYAVVTNVVDGDTFDMDVDLGFQLQISTRFRVLDYDAPEVRRPAPIEELTLGHAATLCAERLLLNKTVIIHCNKKKDSFGRWLCRIQLPNNLDYGTYMTERGFIKSQ